MPASTPDQALGGWWLYVLRCADDSLYCGISTDVERRLAEHRSGGPRAARYVRGRAPLQELLRVALPDQPTALRCERWFKSLSRPQKLAVLAGRRVIPHASLKDGCKMGC
ncbi:MAG: GIY-YIG nuclease family protein [Planctomycetota bacterium]|nr:MAG: GIY-YIG nuclease family protein [Planctomycetota bacterium]